MKKSVSVFWARRDLRIGDNPALTAACAHAKEKGSEFLPLFVLEDYMCTGDTNYQFGLPSRIFLARALPKFSTRFQRFVILRGQGARTIIDLAKHYEISVFVNEDVYEDFYTQVEKIKKAGVSVQVCSDALTVSKETVTGTGNIYSVFTPFKKAVWEQFVAATPLPDAPVEEVVYLSPSDISLIPGSLLVTEDSLLAQMESTRLFKAGNYEYDLDTLLEEKFDDHDWYYSEVEALNRCITFVQHHLSEYKNMRDSLEHAGTSKMSLGLAWGLISSRTIVQKIQQHEKYQFTHIEFDSSREGATHYISELIWREFYKYLLYHYPILLKEEFQPKFRGTISWEDDVIAKERFIAWMRGETGYPIVDAAMHQLARTGWMHNRARMIVASVLTKNLGVDWRWGQEYFRAMLIDLDEASNNGGWQWGASVGADPKPIRIFNPYLQAENYDQSQAYQKEFLPIEYLNNPPKPIVEHKTARQDALRRYGLLESIDGLARDY
jgi:deoxyribodipyrimidine photo-lyase